MSPYHFRLMAALPGQEPIELMRSRATEWGSYWDSHTRHLSAEWDKWVEIRMPDFRCISPRIKVSAVNASKTNSPIYLTHEMKKQAGINMT